MVKEINFSDYSNKDIVIKYAKEDMELTGNMAKVFVDNNSTLRVFSRRIGESTVGSIEALDMIHTWQGVRDAVVAYREVSDRLNSYLIVGQQRTSLQQVLLDSLGTKYGVARRMGEYLDSVIDKALQESKDLTAKLLLGGNVGFDVLGYDYSTLDCPICAKEMKFLHDIAREEFLRGGETYEH